MSAGPSAEIHIVPVQDGHVLTADCPCGPYPDPVEPRVLIHRRLNRA